MGAAKQVHVSKRHAKQTAVDLRALVDASNDAIIGKTIDGTIISWNKGAEKIYGYTADEILGQSISLLIPPGHQQKLPAIMKLLQRGEHIDGYETIHKDGHLIDAAVTISPMKRRGKVVGACIVARDITAQRQAQVALRLSEERFRIALKESPIMVASQDLQLRYTWVGAGKIVKRNIIGRTDAELFPGEEGARLTAIKQEVLRTGIKSHTEITVTTEGKLRYVDLVVEPTYAEGKPLGVLCSAVETTSLKETIATLQQALDEVQVLEGLLPTCASCHRIKDERGDWQLMEGYIQAHSEAKFSHGVCPDCLKKLYPDYYPLKRQYTGQYPK